MYPVKYKYPFITLVCSFLLFYVYKVNKTNYRFSSIYSCIVFGSNAANESTCTAYWNLSGIQMRWIIIYFTLDILCTNVFHLFKAPKSWVKKLLSNYVYYICTTKLTCSLMCFLFLFLVVVCCLFFNTITDVAGCVYWFPLFFTFRYSYFIFSML